MIGSIGRHGAYGVWSAGTAPNWAALCCAKTVRVAAGYPWSRAMGGASHAPGGRVRGRAPHLQRVHGARPGLSGCWGRRRLRVGYRSGRCRILLMIGVSSNGAWQARPSAAAREGATVPGTATMTPARPASSGVQREFKPAQEQRTPHTPSSCRGTEHFQQRCWPGDTRRRLLNALANEYGREPAGSLGASSWAMGRRPRTRSAPPGRADARAGAVAAS